MVITKSATTISESIVDVICDSCGKSCRVNCSIFDAYESMLLHAKWGYGSKNDGEEWTAHICMECVDIKLNFIKFGINDLE